MHVSEIVCVKSLRQFWCHSMQDLSGYSVKEEGRGWFDCGSLPPTVLKIFVELGRLYAPFMGTSYVSTRGIFRSSFSLYHIVDYYTTILSLLYYNIIYYYVLKFDALTAVANAKAVAAGQQRVECMLDNGQVLWQQASFKYQAKCLAWLRSHYSALPSNARGAVDSGSF
jgi:hypothetical protein